MSPGVGWGPQGGLARVDTDAVPYDSADAEEAFS